MTISGSKGQLRDEIGSVWVSDFENGVCRIDEFCSLDGSMARHADHNRSKIYEAAELFCTDCLLKDGSLLFPDTELWNVENLNDLHQAFVGTPDEGDRPFMEKFKDQIESAGEKVVRLAAEILCVYFLFPSNVGGPRKRKVTNEVLSWVDVALPESGIVRIVRLTSDGRWLTTTNENPYLRPSFAIRSNDHKACFSTASASSRTGR